MSNAYGWTYSRQLQNRSWHGPAKRNRYRAAHAPKAVSPVRPKAVTLHWQAAGQPQHAAGWPWEKFGRMLVACMLVAVTLTVVSKGQQWRDQAGDWAWQLWQSLTGSWGQAPSPVNIPVARMAGKPDAVYPWKGQVAALVVDKAFFVLDQRGQIWPLVAEAWPGDAPVITGLVVREEPGDLGVKLSVDMNWELVRRLVNCPDRNELSEVHFGSREGVLLYTRSGMKIVLRDSVHLDRDLVRLHAVLSDMKAKRKSIARVDLRYDQHIVVRPKSRR